MLDILIPKMTTAPKIKVLLNIGCGLDIPTGVYLPTANGRWACNGGLSTTTGIAGPGNSFKSTIMFDMTLRAASRLFSVNSTSIHTYDTEVNIQQSTLYKFTQKFNEFKGRNIIDERIWQISDETVMWGDEYFEELKKLFKAKEASAKKIMVDSPFVTEDGKPFRIMAPTLSHIDSMTKFKDSTMADTQDKVRLGDSKGLTVYMKQGLVKSRMLTSLPTLTTKASNYMFFTAHVGKEHAMSNGPSHLPPPKKINTMKPGEKIKGVTDDWFFLLGNAWMTTKVKVLYNPSDLTPLYPKDAYETKTKSRDLNEVTLSLIRSKSGASGSLVQLVISQTEGVLGPLSDFHYIKTNRYWGLEGGNRSYFCVLLPDVMLSRTKIRRLLDRDEKLCRAIEICSELLQIHTYRKIGTEYLCDPKELYHDLITLGYDWDKILATRGWYTMDNHKHPIESITTYDLLMMRKQELVIDSVKKDS